MTSDFRPGKAYLIEGKGIEQVKSEIKEWFKKNEFKILEEGENEIEGNLLNLWARYDVWLYIKYKSVKGGTLLIFNNKYMKKSEGNILFFPDLKRFVGEWPKNLVRFLSDKKEFGLEYFVKYLNLTYISTILIFIFIIYNPFNLLPELDNVYPTLFGIAMSLFILRFLLSMYKLKKANLPEYKVEEYKGEIESD